MPLRRLLVLVSFAISVACAYPTSAAAQTHDEGLARQLFETGRAYFERAQYEEAAEAFGEAYRLSGRPQLLVNEARALEALGRYADAVAVLERALIELPAESELRPPVEQRLIRLRAHVDRGEGLALPDARVEGPEGPEDPEPRPERGPMWWSGIGAVSLGGAALVVSLGTGVAGHNIAGDLDDACPGGICLPEQSEEASRGQALSATSTAMLVVGLSASLAGILLILLTDEESEAEAVDVELTAGPGDLGAGMRLRF